MEVLESAQERRRQWCGCEESRRPLVAAEFQLRDGRCVVCCYHVEHGWARWPAVVRFESEVGEDVLWLRRSVLPDRFFVFALEA